MSLTHGERVLSRARSLMANKGYGWSKAINLAAQTIGDTPMTTSLPTRQQIDRAGDLDFDAPRSAPKDLHISIELAPDGLHIKAEYIGALASIPTAVERLCAAGLLDLIAQHRAAPTAAPAPAGKPKAETVEPVYKPDGTPCCPVHQRPLSQGSYGLYCSAKAQPGQQANPKGYCALKFTD